MALCDRVAEIQLARGRPIDWYFGLESFCHDFLLLARLFAFIIWSDSWDSTRIKGHPWMDSVCENEPIVFTDKARRDGKVALPYCRICQCDIWNLHTQCYEKIHGSAQPYILCIDCFGLGRGCLHRATPHIFFHRLFPLEDAIKIYKKSAKVWNGCSSLKDVKGFQVLNLDWRDE